MFSEASSRIGRISFLSSPDFTSPPEETENSDSWIFRQGLKVWPPRCHGNTFRILKFLSACNRPISFFEEEEDSFLVLVSKRLAELKFCPKFIEMEVDGIKGECDNEG